MKRIIHAVILLLGTVATQGQVRLLWKTSITNIPLSLVADDSPSIGTNYLVMESRVDSGGNIVIGGRTKTEIGNSGGTFVMKFDATGRKLWETSLSTNSFGGVDDTAIDGEDRIIVSARLTPYPYEGNRPCSLIQLSPSGTEVWRKTEDFAAAAGYDYYSMSALKLDTLGNILFSFVTLTSKNETYTTTLWAAKFTSAGWRLWKKPLPIEGPVVHNGDLSRYMTATSDGGMVMAACEYPSGAWHLFKLDSHGKLDLRLKDWRAPYVNCLAINLLGTQICVGSDRGVFFSHLPSGFKYPGNLKQGVIEHLQPTGDNAFLAWDGANLAKFDAYGRALWRTNTGFFQTMLGIVPDSNAGWIIAGDNSSAMTSQTILFKSFSNTGNLLWQTNFSGFSYQSERSYTRTLQTIHRAPDGTLRVVVNETYNYYPYITKGIGIYSFAVDR